MSQYVVEILSRKNETSLEFDSKAVGEFSLLIYLSRRHSGVAAEHLRRAFEPITAQIETWAGSLKASKADDVYGLCTTLDFVDLGHLDCSQRVKMEIQNRIPSFFSSPRSEEHAFYLASIGVPISVDFWRSRTKALLDRMLSDGASTKDLYDYTHVVFFATNFGLSTCDSIILPYLSSLTDMFYDMSVRAENWDAQIEICAAYLCLQGDDRDFIMLQGEEGWILSDGFQRPKSFNNRTLYSLFHTTCIMMMYQMISEAHVDARKGK